MANKHGSTNYILLSVVQVSMLPENRLYRKHKSAMFLRLFIFITAIYVNDMFMYSVIYAIPND